MGGMLSAAGKVGKEIFKLYLSVSGLKGAE